MSGHGFIDPVIEGFPEHLVETFFAIVADVHTGALSDGFKSFKDSDGTGVVSGFDFFCELVFGGSFSRRDFLVLLVLDGLIFGFFAHWWVPFFRACTQVRMNLDFTRFFLWLRDGCGRLNGAYFATGSSDKSVQIFSASGTVTRCHLGSNRMWLA